MRLLFSHPTEDRRFFPKLLLRLQDMFGKPAEARAFDLNASWKKHHRLKQRFFTASGAQWFRDCEGYVQLLKADDVELKTAMFELLEHYGSPIAVRAQQFQENCIWLDALVLGVEKGFAIAVEYLEGPCPATCCQCDKSASHHSPDPGYQTEGSYHE